MVCLTVSSEMQIHLIVYKRELIVLLPVKGNFPNLKITFMKQKGECKIFAKSGTLFHKEVSHLKRDGALSAIKQWAFTRQEC